MTKEEYLKLDATAMAELVQKKEVEHYELLEVAIGLAEAVNPALNAIIHPMYELGREMAEQIDNEAPFAGVPFLIKDLAIHIAGTPLSDGSAGYRKRISELDSYSAQRYREAGLLFMGKTNTPEFGFTPWTEPSAFGPTRNPWNTERTPGGSSGGSGAAVAAGIVPMATASDGGGSIRIPASCCGLFGLKPSRGRISLGPQAGESWSGATMEHCVSWSVRDSARLLDATQGDSPGEGRPIRPPERPYAEEIKEDPQPLRVGFTVQHPLGQTVDQACVDAVQHTAQLLESLGHHVEEAKPPYERKYLTESFITMVGGEAAATLDELGEYLGRPVRPSDVEPATFATALLGRTMRAVDYAKVGRQWNELSRRMGAFHQTYDLLLTPTVARRPFLIGAMDDPQEERLIRFVNRFRLGKLVYRERIKIAEKTFGYIPFTPFANMTGQPSMSVPLHQSEDGLPVGSMFTAPIGREDILFRLAGQLERAQPWTRPLDKHL